MGFHAFIHRRNCLYSSRHYIHTGTCGWDFRWPCNRFCLWSGEDFAMDTVRVILVALILMLGLSGCYNKYSLPEGSYSQGRHHKNPGPCKAGFKQVHFKVAGGWDWVCVPK